MWVLGAGFMLGIFRTLWLVPRFGVRTAELMEMPFMLIAIVIVGRWISRRIGFGERGSVQLKVGMSAFVMLVTTEIAFGVLLRGLSPIELLRDRDPVSGAVYYLLLVMFAVWPWAYWRFVRRGVT